MILCFCTEKKITESGLEIHSSDWEMILNNAHDPTTLYLIIHYEIVLFLTDHAKNNAS